MNVLIACEYSGRVRDAFRARGHAAWSCDLDPCEGDSRWHHQGDVLKFFYSAGISWDLMIGHPPCTYLAHSGIRWLYNNGRKVEGRDEKRWDQMREGAEFFTTLWNLPVKRICLENPRMHPYAKARIAIPDAQTQVIQPHNHGEEAFKATGLTLKNLPPLVATNQLVVPLFGTPEYKRWSAIHREAPGPDRQKNRSRTFNGVANAMAEQWQFN